MRVFVVTPPEPVVSLKEAKEHLRVTSASEDALIEGFVASATATLDGPDGWLGRSLGQQTLEARFDRFDEQGCSGVLALPCPPVVDVATVKYIAGDGGEQTVDASDYWLLRDDLARAYGKPWPTARCEPEAVRVRYTAGYATLPAPIRASILLMVGDFFLNREASSSDSWSGTVLNLLQPFRIWG